MRWPRTEGLRPALWLPILYAFDYHGAAPVEYEVFVLTMPRSRMPSRNWNRATTTVVSMLFN